MIRKYRTVLSSFDRRSHRDVISTHLSPAYLKAALEYLRPTGNAQGECPHQRISFAMRLIFLLSLLFTFGSQVNGMPVPGSVAVLAVSSTRPVYSPTSVAAADAPHAMNTPGRYDFPRSPGIRLYLVVSLLAPASC